MSPNRAIAVALALSLGIVLLLGVWLLRRAHPDREPRDAPPATFTPAPPSPVPTPTRAAGALPAAARGYRLAGTVVGDLAYAIIETPDGANQLYRPGQRVPGLGEVSGIEPDRITLAGSDGPFTLQLAPAPTTAPTPRAFASASPSASAVTPARRRPRDPSGSESSP